jgi:hypothetical protein
VDEFPITIDKHSGKHIEVHIVVVDFLFLLLVFVILFVVRIIVILNLTSCALELGCAARRG